MNSGRATAARDGPNPIDVHVGSRVRLRRKLLGLSQGKLAAALGLTFHQVQKYERGKNRMGSSRLYQLSEILDVPVSFFFDKMPPLEGKAIPPGLAESPASFERDPMIKRETLELVRAYYRVTDEAARKRLFELVKAMGRLSAETED